MVDTVDLVRLCREIRAMSQEDLSGIVNAYLEGEGTREAFNGGFSIGLAASTYLQGILYGKGLSEHADEIGDGVVQRLLHRAPDNAQNHPELLAFSINEIRDYVDRWERYNSLFREAA